MPTPKFKGNALTAFDPTAATPAKGGELEARRIVSRLVLRIATLAVALMLLGATALSYVAVRIFDRDLDTLLAAKAAALGWVLSEDFGRAAALGFPLDRLPDVPRFLEEARSGHAEILYLALLDPAGVPIHATGGIAPDDLSIMTEAIRGASADSPIESMRLESERLNMVLQSVVRDGKSVAAVAVGVDQQYAQRQFEEMVFDVLTVLMVSLFISFEILLAILGRSMITPLRHLVTLLERGSHGRFVTRLEHRSADSVGSVIDAYNKVVDMLHRRYAGLSAKAAAAGHAMASVLDIGHRAGLHADGRPRTLPATSALDVRLPLFLFVFAEELQKPFLPLYVRDLAVGETWLSPEILIGLPISVYMLVLAIATPFAGSLADRFGIKRIFLAGLLPAIVGFIGAAAAQDVVSLLIARSTTALGYAAVTIAAQGYIAGVTTSGERATGMAGYVGTIMIASICGMAVGGIVAGELGYRIVFFLAAILAALAGIAGMQMLAAFRAHDGDTGVRRTSTLAALGIVLSNRLFLALVVFVAIPGKIALTGFLFYSVPLYLAALGTGEAEIGRLMILYALLVIFAGPVLSRLADRAGHTMLFTFAGTLLSGLAIALLDGWQGALAMVVAVGLLGIAHAASISPQLALATEVCRKEVAELGQTTILGLLRMLERIGSVGGPLLVGALVAWRGFEAAMLLTGLGIAVAAVAFLLINVAARRRG